MYRDVFSPIIIPSLRHEVEGRGRREARRINRTPPKHPTYNFLWPLVVAAPSLVRPPAPPLPPTDLRYLAQMLSEFTVIEAQVWYNLLETLTLPSVPRIWQAPIEPCFPNS